MSLNYRDSLLLSPLFPLFLFRWIMYACPGHYHTPWVGKALTKARATTAPIVFPFRPCNELLGRLSVVGRPLDASPLVSSHFKLQFPDWGYSATPEKARTNSFSPLHRPLPSLFHSSSLPYSSNLILDLDDTPSLPLPFVGMYLRNIDSGGQNKQKKREVGRER